MVEVVWIALGSRRSLFHHFLYSSSRLVRIDGIKRDEFSLFKC